MALETMPSPALEHELSRQMKLPPISSPSLKNQEAQLASPFRSGAVSTIQESKPQFLHLSPKISHSELNHRNDLKHKRHSTIVPPAQSQLSMVKEDSRMGLKRAKIPAGAMTNL